MVRCLIQTRSCVAVHARLYVFAILALTESGAYLDDFLQRLDAFVHQVLGAAAEVEFADGA